MVCEADGVTGGSIFLNLKKGGENEKSNSHGIGDSYHCFSGSGIGRDG
jgi:hypothetical protein